MATSWTAVIKNSATWTNTTETQLGSYLLLENVDRLLLENNGGIILESGSAATWSNQTKN